MKIDKPYIWQYRVLSALLSRWEAEYGHLGVDLHVRLLRICLIMTPDIPVQIFGHLLCPLFVTEPLMQEHFRVLYRQIIQELGLLDADSEVQNDLSTPALPETTKTPATAAGKKAKYLERVSALRTETLIAELDQCVDPPLSWNIIVSDESNTNSLLKNSPEYALSNRFGKIAQYLLRRETIGTNVLDLPVTIQATIRQYGLPDLKYYTPTQSPEYLLLIERFSRRDHRAGLFDFFFEELRSKQVFVERFFYDGDPRICRNRQYPAGLTMRQLRLHYPDARILILGSGHRFIDNRTSNLCDWTIEFQDWPLRVLLTPIPPGQWGYHENRLKKFFAILPATVSSLQYISEFPELMATQYEEIPDFIQQLSNIKSIELEEPIVLSLSEHFGPSMLCWIASCAIYPSLHYPLTLQIGRLLSDRLGLNLLSLEHMTALSTIPWFADGKIPFEYRKELVAYLKHRHLRHYDAVKLYLQQLMEDNPPPKNSVAWADHQMQLALYRASSLPLPSESTPEELRTMVKKMYREKRLEDFPLPEPWSAMLEKWNLESDTQSNFDDHANTGVSHIDERALEAALQELQLMIGLKDVKKKIIVWVDAVKQNILVNRQGGAIEHPSTYPNFIFAGNRGTGKTSVAQILGKILKALGLLENGYAIEAHRSDFVATRAQQTETKTRRLVARHRGNLLVVADAHSLHSDISDTYGKAAVQTLASLMDEQRGRFAMVACGNTRNMEAFMSFNPEIKDKFPIRIRFEDYSIDDLIKIFQYLVQKRGYLLAENSDKDIKNQIILLKAKKGADFGNAREVEYFLDSVVLPNYQRRALHLEKGKLMVITKDDFLDYSVESTPQLGTPIQSFEVTCSRCNKRCSEPVVCERFDCELPEYHNAYAKKFKVAPTKYYISLLGGVNSSRTYYFLVLAYELLKNNKNLKYFERFGITNIKIIDPVSNKLFDTLLTEAEHGKLRFTTSLGYLNFIITLKNSKIYEITIFNTRGEDLEGRVGLSEFNTTRHDLKGSATILFIDPREDSGLNKLINNPLENSLCSDKKFADYIYKVMQHVNNGVKVINNPLAVCISKYDLLLHLVPENSFTELDEGYLFYEKIDKNSIRLANFLKQYSNTIDPISLQKQFAKHKYFSVAPYGSDATPAYWKNRASKGIIAPFFWALRELGIIPRSFATTPS